MFFLYSLVCYYFIFLSDFKLCTPICQVLIYVYRLSTFAICSIDCLLLTCFYLFIYIVLITKVLISSWQSHLLLFFKKIFMDTLKFILKNEHVKYFVKIPHLKKKLDLCLRQNKKLQFSFGEFTYFKMGSSKSETLIWFPIYSSFLLFLPALLQLYSFCVFVCMQPLVKHSALDYGCRDQIAWVPSLAGLLTNHVAYSPLCASLFPPVIWGQQ